VTTKFIEAYKPSCPECGAAPPIRIGPGVSFGSFAGGQFVGLEKNCPIIYRCSKCFLVFKWPQPSKSDSLALYNEADGSVWASDMPRPEFEIAKKTLHGRATEETTVLDVGCNQGGFLARLDHNLHRFGVEVNRAAAGRALVHCESVWSSVEEIPSQLAFDVITCFDVLEHIAQPAAFVVSLLSQLREGGALVLSTGDANVFIKQPKPSLNWYFSNPEHVSFISDEWIEAVLSDSGGWRVEMRHAFLHGKTQQGLVPLLKIAAFKAAPTAYLRGYTLLKSLFSRQTGLFVPGNGFSQDHVCYVIRKPNAYVAA
jgi:SAM-dependent methyltransferase